MKYMRLAVFILIMATLCGCSNSSGVTTQGSVQAGSSQKQVVEAFISAFNNGDVETCVSLLSAEIVTELQLGDQEYSSQDAQSVEAGIKNNIMWHHQWTILEWTSTSGNIISLRMEESGDDLKIQSIDTLSSEVTYEVGDGRIVKISTVVDEAGAAKIAAAASGGIGFKIVSAPESITVGEVMAGAPADRAGLKTGDKIVAIDGIKCAEMREGEAMLRLRGPVSSKVTLTIGRANGTFDVEVVRADLTSSAGN
jgi:hypothetical protein